MSDVNDLKAENEQLRKERDFYYQQVTDNGERAHNAIDALNAENAKLRELLSELYESAWLEYPSAFEHTFGEWLRELGIEVDA